MQKITLTYEDNLPAPLPDEAVKAGAKQVSKVFVLNRDDSTDFGKSIAITVPFSVKDVPADQVPVVIYWDDTLKTYSPVAVRSIDRDKGMLTFITAHASKYSDVYRSAERQYCPGLQIIDYCDFRF
jgi:hypothetical protein